MKKSLVITMLVIASLVLTVGIVKAAGVTTDWLRVGVQGEGGVTYFNGTIINETTGDNDANNPVTFGDNVRIDGRVYRGATAGTSDSLPFIVNDNMEVTGSLTVGGLSGDGVVSAANIDPTSNIEVNSLATTEDILAGGSISWGTRTGHVSVSPAGCTPSYNDTFSVSSLSLYPDTSATFYCPLQLPDGVTVTKAEFMAMDSNDADIEVTLLRGYLREIGLGGYILTILSTSGSSETLQTISDSTLNFVVDNYNYNYSYSVTFGDGDYSLRYAALVITYTYTTPH